MTINAPAPVLVAMYVVAAELQGVPAASVRGTAQNDVLKEYVARGTYIYPPRPSAAARRRPRRLVRERGAALQRDLALRLPHARGGLHGGAGDGVRVRQRDRLRRGACWRTASPSTTSRRGSRGSSTRTRTSSRRSRSTARCGACGRRSCATASARVDARSLQLRTHTQTGGSTLTLQQPENNIVRAALQALAAVLGGVQSLALSCYDEAIAIPTEHAQTLAVRTQQILAEEIGVTDTADPLGGSWFVESLTDELERARLGAAGRGRAARRRRGGGRDRLLPAGDRRGGLPRRDGAGVGRARRRRRQPLPRGRRSRARVLPGRPRARRRPDRAPRRPCAPRATAPRSRPRWRRCARDCERPEVNAMPAIVAAVRARATLGEICGAMRSVFGEYKPA